MARRSFLVSAAGSLRTLGLLLGLVIMPAFHPLAAQSLDGTYHGDISGTPATLTLQTEGAALRGAIDADGYDYTLAGTVAGGGASGTLTDPQVRTTMPFELAQLGDALTLTIVVADAFGQVRPLVLAFYRGERPGASGSDAAARRPSGAAAQRDPALIGSWVHSDSYVSGDFSGTTRLHLQVNADGTYCYGSGAVTIGGANAYGSYAGRSGGGDGTQGQWRTEGGVVYVKEAGAAGWTPHARYYVEGARMLFTFGDGSRQLWTRQ